MNVRTLLRVALASLACLAVQHVEAAPPWRNLVPLKHIEADPDKNYELADGNGPWMIIATTFSGDGADQQAHDLVYELRKTYKLPAYRYQKQFDFSQGIQARSIDRFGNPVKMKNQKGESRSEIAVLVGDFQSITDPDAQKVLKKIKVMEPEALKVKNGKTNQNLATLRMVQKALLPENSEQKKKGPMGHAFLANNPLLPPDYYVPKGVDKLVLEMNKGVKHSLLDCPGRYTVVVATFSGSVTVDQKIIQKVEAGANVASRLAEAAEKAHKLTEALLQKGYEAYEFHDRYSSMVAVGSFNSVGTPRLDGKIEINPKIHSIMEKFGVEKQQASPGAAPKMGQPKSLIGIPFDVQPTIVQVPKRSIASDYGRTADLR